MQGTEQFHEERQIGSGTVFQYIGSTAITAGGALFYIFVVKLLPQDTVGTISLFQAIIVLFSALFSLGLPFAAKHFISYYRGKTYAARKTIRIISVLSLILAFSSGVAIFLFSDNLATYFYHGSNKPSFLILVRFLFPVGALSLTGGMLNSILLGMQRYRESGLASIVTALGGYAFPLSLLLIFSYGLPGSSLLSLIAEKLGGNLPGVGPNPASIIVLGWYFGYTFSLLVAIAFILAAMRRDYPKRTVMREYEDNVKLTTTMIKYSLPMFFSSIISVGAIYADRLTVAFYLPQAELGVYSFGLLIATGIGFLVNPVNNVLLPKISQFFASRNLFLIRRGVGVTGDVISFIYVPMALFIIAIARGFVIVLGKPDYVGAAMPFSIILGTSALFITQSVLVQALAGTRKTRVFVLTTSSSLLSNLLLSVLLIPHYGLIGAAIGFSSMYIVSFVILYFFAGKLRVREYHIKRLFKIWLSAIVMFLSVFITSNYILTIPSILYSRAMAYISHDIIRLVLYIVVGFLVYIAMIRMTKAIERQEIDFIYRFVPKRLQFTRRYLEWVFSPRENSP